LTPTEEKILIALADGEWHDAGELAKAAGTDLPGLKQVIPALGRTGLRFERGPAPSYRIEGGLDMFYNHMISKEIFPSAQADLIHLDRYWETDSTNERLLARAATASIHGHCALAEFQTAGRGRQGRQWHAPLGAGLCLSLGWEFAGKQDPDNTLSLVAALALTRALQGCGAQDIALKWPNDVQWRGRKLAGILVERRWRTQGGCDAVIGIGLNTGFPAWFSKAAEAGWADLRSVLGRPVSRNALAGAVLSHLCMVLREYAESGFAPFRPEWRQLDALLGQAVTVHTAAGTVQGRAAGIDERGALLVETGGVRQVFHSAEVSVRLSA
jgi:BirA family biotin operon repressor/biotin-[acetyl-CoA-carboxylase] ligase